jgi:hypothetical protein
MIPIAEKEYWQNGWCETGDKFNITVTISDDVVVKS